MKRILLLTVFGIALLLFSASGAWAFGVKDVLKMNGAGIPDSLIILKIENSGKVFHLSGDDIKKLHDADVSNEVIAAMLRTEGERDDDYYGYYGRPYYDYHPYPYYSYPYSRLYLGFGFGGRGYYGHRYGGYYVPRYRPYSSGGNFGTQRYRGSYGSRISGGGGAGQYGGRSGGSGSSRPGGSGTRSRTR